MRMRTRLFPYPAVRLLAAGLLIPGVLALLTLSSCATLNERYDATRAHHRPEGFRNPHSSFEPRGMLSFLQWQWDAVRDGLPPPVRTPTPVVEPDLRFIHGNAAAGAAMEPALTWIGHASMLVQMSGLNLLLDPVFSLRASPVGFAGPVRAQAPGLAVAQLPRIDAVLISHNHYDHLDEASVQALAAQAGGSPLFVVPLGLKAWFAAIGIGSVVELDWWDTHTVRAAGGPVEVMLTPAQHWSGRTLADRMATLWGGFAVLGPDFHLYYSGDTGYSPDFKHIRERLRARQGRLGFDLALIPVGAYEPRWFMRQQHVDPAEAVQIHLDVAARKSVGVHWGTFNLSDESLDEPPRALQQAVRERGLLAGEFTVMAVGETRRYPRRPASPLS